MQISATIGIFATPAKIFQLYENIESWRSWDPEVADVHLPDGLKVGSTGWLKPRAGPKAKIRVSEVTQGRSFTVESALPLCRMTFNHQLKAGPNQTEATHWAEFFGPLSFIFRRLIGKQIKASLPQTMLGLKRACENDLEPS